MSILIYNANIITGDGKTILGNHSLRIDGQLIDSVSRVPYPPYDQSDRAINAMGGFLIPGIINQHAHGFTSGTWNYSAEEPFPRYKRMQMLNKHLLDGTTTIVNMDGFATIKEVEEARGTTPILVQTASTHTPLFLATANQIGRGALREEHLRTTVKDMVRGGALGIGEVCLPYDLRSFIGIVRNETGVDLPRDIAEIFGVALWGQPQVPDEKAALDLMTQRGIGKAIYDVKRVLEKTTPLVENSLKACWEAAELASELGVPLWLHNHSNTKSLVLDFARKLEGQLIASHSNVYSSTWETLEVARAVKKAGGWVDVIPGDFFGGRQMIRNHANTLALLAEGLVDMVSTDIMGGYWSSILQLMEYGVEQNVIDLPQAIALGTGNVLKAIPNIAPNRGEIAEGRVADLAILSPKHISEVRTVIIGGKVVAENGKIIPVSEQWP